MFLDSTRNGYCPLDATVQHDPARPTAVHELVGIELPRAAHVFPEVGGLERRPAVRRGSIILRLDHAEGAAAKAISELFTLFVSLILAAALRFRVGMADQARAVPALRPEAQSTAVHERGEHVLVHL